MNDNGLPNDPLSAAQFNVPALTRHSILQNVDRTNGEHFPTIAGDFFHVDSVDFPARISFGNTDPEQSIPLIPGLEVRGRFSGITIYHDNWSGSVDRPKIQFNLGRGNVLTINNSLGRTGIQLPAFAQSTAATFNISVPVPYGYHLMDLNVYHEYNNPTLPDRTRIFVQFLTFAGVVTPPSLTRNTVTYTGANDYAALGLTNWQSIGLPASNNWATLNEFKDIPIPSGAERLRVFASLPAALTAVVVARMGAFAR